MPSPKIYTHAFHAQQGIECEQCHGNGSLHVDGSGDVTKIVAFSKRTPDQANGVCLSCHAKNEQTRNWISGSHAANHLRCTDCHQIHQIALKAAKGNQIGFDEATTRAPSPLSPQKPTPLSDPCGRPTKLASNAIPRKSPSSACRTTIRSVKAK